MTRMIHPLSVPDISTYAKNIRVQLLARHAAGKSPPSHLELLNLLAAAAGLRNFQTLKASTSANPDAGLTGAIEPAETSTSAVVDSSTDLVTEDDVPPDAIRKALLQFDEFGRLVRLPNKLSVQRVVMWSLWTRFASARKYSEKEVNAILNAWHTFHDQATLRRELVNMKLLGRKPDGSRYWKEAARPGESIQGFLRTLRDKATV